MKTHKVVVSGFAPKREAIGPQGWVRYKAKELRDTPSVCEGVAVLILGLMLEFPSGIALHGLTIMRGRKKCKRSLPCSLA